MINRTYARGDDASHKDTGRGFRSRPFSTSMPDHVAQNREALDIAEQFGQNFNQIDIFAKEMIQDKFIAGSIEPLLIQGSCEGQSHDFEHKSKEIPNDENNIIWGHEDIGSNSEKNSSAFEIPPAYLRGMSQNPTLMGVKTLLLPGHAPRAFMGFSPVARGCDSAKYGIVSPGGTPTVNNSATADQCQPATSRAVLNWNVVSADENNWGANVTSLILVGNINIFPWPYHPTRMSVPNTPNPVDGGNINNTPDSPNYWEAAIDDMADYNSALAGGSGPNWHSTAASIAHEWAHWNRDYVENSVMSPAGGNWPQTNNDLDELRQPKASSRTAAAARRALQPRVDSRMETWRDRTHFRWRLTPDNPGMPSAAGYAAGMAVLNNHIAAVRAYAISKGWTASP